MKNFLKKIGGRKFLVAVFGVVTVVVMSLTGIDIAQYQDALIGILGTYLLGQGLADGLSGGATSTTSPKANRSDPWAQD